MSRHNTDYPPIRITEQEYRDLRQIDSSKKMYKWFNRYLLKWNVRAKCNSYEEIGYFYQFRVYKKWWIYLLTYIPATIYRFHQCIWNYGLCYFSPYSRLFIDAPIYNGSSYEPLNEINKAEFARIDKFWNERFK